MQRLQLKRQDEIPPTVKTPLLDNALRSKANDCETVSHHRLLDNQLPKKRDEKETLNQAQVEVPLVSCMSPALKSTALKQLKQSMQTLRRQGARYGVQ